MITRLKFVSIPTTDQARALKFWTEQIGLRIVTDQPMGEQRWIELSVGDGDARVALFTPDGHEGRIGDLFNGSFACDDVEATHRQLTARGVEFVTPPTAQPWGTYAVFRDPDGNRFVISPR